jgi:6-pyruvoyltetrahydropterin/6-carboxytetrahydropterin synthase
MPGVFEVSVEAHFAAAHSLKGYQGDCAEIHGHNWNVEVFVRCARLNEIGIGIDFRDVKQAIGELMEGLDHTCLNDHPDFARDNPTSENVARFLYRKLGEKLNSETLKVAKVKVSETRTTAAFYWEE